MNLHFSEGYNTEFANYIIDEVIRKYPDYNIVCHHGNNKALICFSDVNASVFAGDSIGKIINSIAYDGIQKYCIFEKLPDGYANPAIVFYAKAVSIQFLNNMAPTYE